MWTITYIDVCFPVLRKAEHHTTREALPEVHSPSFTSLPSPLYVHSTSLQQCYHVVQTLAYAVMAVLIMRLKLFLTPQLAVLTSLLAHHKVAPLTPVCMSQF